MTILFFLLELLQDWAFFALWQSFLFLGTAVELERRFLHRSPWQGHLILTLGIVASVLAPIVSLFVYRSGGGILPDSFFAMQDHASGPAWVLAPVILVGGLIFGLLLLFEVVSARHLMFRARPFPDRESQEALLEGSRMMRNVSLPILFTSDAVKSPTVWSWGLHPAVLLPETLTDTLSSQERDAIFLHELAHLIRRDHWAAFLNRICGVVLFWNPLYWFAVKRADLAADRACDLLVLSQEKVSTELYGETLLRLAAGEKNRPVLQYLSRKEQLMKRIETILDYEENRKNFSVKREPAKLTVLVTVALLLSATLAFCQEKKTDPPAEEAQKTEIESYRVDRKVGDFPVDQIDLSTPEAAYALGNRLIAGDEPDKVNSLRLYTVNRNIPENMVRWVESMSSEDREKLVDATILQIFTYKDKTAMVVAQIEKDKKYSTRLFANEHGRWFNVGGGGFFGGKSDAAVIKTCETSFRKEARRWDKEKPVETWKTPDQAGYTHLFIFEPYGGFQPKNAEELLNKLNEYIFKQGEIPNGYFRSHTDKKGTIVGRICTNNPSRLTELIDSISELNLIRIWPLDQKVFEEHIGKKIVDPSAVPKVVRFEPALDAEEIDPNNVKAIRVTFDRDMDRGGFSWCGGPPLYPETTGKPRWVDKRTCVLPVRLKEKRFYRLSINCPSARNFKSEKGAPAEETPYFFATKDYYPKIIELNPVDEAKDVEPESVKELRVTFDQDMNTGGCSWCGGGDDYPETSGPPRWIDSRTCVLPVKLVREKTYRLSINSQNFRNFQSTDGRHVKPTPYTFSTVGANEDPSPPDLSSGEGP